MAFIRAAGFFAGVFLAISDHNFFFTSTFFLGVFDALLTSRLTLLAFFSESCFPLNSEIKSNDCDVANERADTHNNLGNYINVKSNLPFVTVSFAFLELRSIGVASRLFDFAPFGVFAALFP